MNTNYFTNPYSLRIPADLRESTDFISARSYQRWALEDRRSFRQHRRLANRLAREAE